MALVKVLNSAGAEMSSIDSGVDPFSVPKGALSSPEDNITASTALLSPEGLWSTPITIKRRRLITSDIETTVNLVETTGAVTIDLNGERSQIYTWEQVTDGAVINIENFTPDLSRIITFVIARKHPDNADILSIDFANSTINGVAGNFTVKNSELGQNPFDLNYIAFSLQSSTDVVVEVSGIIPALPPGTAGATTVAMPGTFLTRELEGDITPVPLGVNELATFATPSVLSGSGIRFINSDTELETTDNTPVKTAGLIKNGVFQAIRTQKTEASGELIIDIPADPATQYDFTHDTDGLLLRITTDGTGTAQSFTLSRTKSADADPKNIDWTNSTINGISGLIEVRGQALGQASGAKNLIRLYSKDGVSFTAVIDNAR